MKTKNKTKTCSCCKKKYSNIPDNFYKNFYKGKQRDGFISVCKKCKREYGREYGEKNKEKNKKVGKQYRAKNKEKIKQYGKEYRRKNKEKIKIRDKEYYLKNKEKIGRRSALYYLNNQPSVKEYYKRTRDIRSIKHKAWLKKNAVHVKQYARERYNKEEKRIYNHQYHVKNKKRLNSKSREYSYKNRSKINEYVRHKRKTDPLFRIRMGLSSRLRMLLKLTNTKKTLSTIQLLGCSVHYLKTYLESKFLPGMTWDNYGYYGWHVDHIVPCAKFDLTKEKEQKKCFHYKNLQPLWWRDNLNKQSFYNGKMLRKKQI
jgi:hypothetical protein